MGGKGDQEAILAERIDRLKRAIPYLASEMQDRQPGAYPAIDAAGPLADRLGLLISKRSGLGPGRWEALGSAVLPVAQRIVRSDIGLFEQLTKLRVAELAQTNGSLPESALEVLSIFGPNVAQDVANAIWQFGYAGCAARLFLEAERAKSAFPTPSSDLAAVYGRAAALRRAPLDMWVDTGTEPPLNGTLVLEVVGYLADQEFKRLYPLFGPENEGEARGQLRGLAVWGYALGRAHLEQTALEAIPLP